MEMIHDIVQNMVQFKWLSLSGMRSSAWVRSKQCMIAYNNVNLRIV